jgi:hypothetical protein
MVFHPLGRPSHPNVMNGPFAEVARSDQPRLTNQPSQIPELASHPKPNHDEMSRYGGTLSKSIGRATWLLDSGNDPWSDAEGHYSSNVMVGGHLHIEANEQTSEQTPLTYLRYGDGALWRHQTFHLQ